MKYIVTSVVIFLVSPLELFKLTQASVLPRETLERGKRSVLDRVDVDNIWQRSLLKNIPLMSQLAAQIIPPLSYSFLSSPRDSLVQVLNYRIKAIIDFDDMLPYVLSSNKILELKGQVSEQVKTIAGEISCVNITRSPLNDARATDAVINILTEYNLLTVNRNPDCFNDDARYSGTDYVNGKVVEGIANSIQECQDSCIDEPQCNFFIFFKEDHYQQEKRNVCRLLRFNGELEVGREGHVSGPKYCDGIFYPQVFAKKLRSWMLEMYPSYRQVECNMDMVRSTGKFNIDQMYYLTDQDKKSFMMDAEYKKCDLCPNEVCQNQGDSSTSSPVSLKVNIFVDNLKAVSLNMSELLSPLAAPGTFTENSILASREKKVLDVLETSYNQALVEAILADDTCTATKSITKTDNIDNEMLVPNFETIDDNSAMTTLIPQSTTSLPEPETTKLETTDAVTSTTTGATTVVSSEDLPLCSEVSTTAPKIGLGLISKFGIATSTTTSAPCRTEDPTAVTTTPTAEESLAESTSTTKGSNTGDLFQKLAEKFGRK